MESFKTFIRNTFSLKVGSASTDEIYAQVQDGAQIKGSNMWILICAIFIASIGLNMNSTAVIIGAMLISPLMGGIISMAYGLATNNIRHTKNAFLKFALQIGISLATSFIYFKLSPISVADSELLARTSPTIWDVLIASFGGFAGVIGITRKEKTNVIPGVAIATALMPPLCTAGYGLAVGSLAYFSGALYLFFINTFFICVTSVIVLKLLHIPVREFSNQKAKNRSSMIIAVIAIITIIPSVYFGYQIANETIVKSNYQNYIKNEFHFEETQVVSSQLMTDDNLIEVALVGKTLGDDQIHALAEKLPEYSLASMSLKVNQTVYDTGVSKEDVEALINQNIDDKNQQAATEWSDMEELLSSAQMQLLESQANDIDMVTIAQDVKALYPQVDSCAGAILSIPAKNYAMTYDSAILVVHTTQPLTDAEKAQLTNWLEMKTEKKSVYLYESPVPITSSLDVQPAASAAPDAGQSGQTTTIVPPDGQTPAQDDAPAA